MMRWAALGLALAGSACAVPIAHIDEVALEAGPAASVPAGPVEARDCRWWVLGVPFGLPRIDGAVRAALAEQEARALRDVHVTSEHPTWGPVGQHCYAVRGTAWR